MSQKHTGSQGGKGSNRTPRLRYFFLMASSVDFALFHTIYLCWLLFEYTCVSSCFHDYRYAKVVWGGDIKIGARSCWGMGVFVLVFSNINIVWEKLLSAPLSFYFYFKHNNLFC